MADAWDEIQAIKSKRNSLRERLEKRKKERQDILGTAASSASTTTGSSTSSSSDIVGFDKKLGNHNNLKSEIGMVFRSFNNCSKRKFTFLTKFS